METLGSSVAQLHAWWYLRAARDFPYERRSHSAACIPPGHGDFDNGALVGGTPLRVLHLVEEGLRGALHDIRHGLNSAYESHLDRYFFLPKPATLLSPGYGWDAVLRPPAQVRHVKVLRRSKGGLVTASAAGPRDSGARHGPSGPGAWKLAPAGKRPFSLDADRPVGRRRTENKRMIITIERTAVSVSTSCR